MWIYIQKPTATFQTCNPTQNLCYSKGFCCFIFTVYLAGLSNPLLLSLLSYFNTFFADKGLSLLSQAISNWSRHLCLYSDIFYIIKNHTFLALYKKFIDSIYNALMLLSRGVTKKIPDFAFLRSWKGGFAQTDTASILSAPCDQELVVTLFLSLFISLIALMNHITQVVFYSTKQCTYNWLC